MTLSHHSTIIVIIIIIILIIIIIIIIIIITTGLDNTLRHQMLSHSLPSSCNSPTSTIIYILYVRQ